MQGSSQPVLLVDRLGKKYRLGDRRSLVPMPSLRARDRTAAYQWALLDVSFTLARGERLAVVGSNGSGKSTLLRILARQTPPTSGRIIVRGRVLPMVRMGVSLLDANRTGRENVQLMGALLGVPRGLIIDRLDEILEFAEVTEHAERELSTWSNGMIVRLATAMTLLLDPDLLLVDERLAGGDRMFQDRASARLEYDVDHGGTAMVMATHDLDAARKLCTTGMWLDDGSVVAHGPLEDVLSQYEAAVPSSKRRAVGGEDLLEALEQDVDEEDDEVVDVDDRDQTRRPNDVDHRETRKAERAVARASAPDWPAAGKVHAAVSFGLDGHQQEVYATYEPITLEVDVELDESVSAARPVVQLYRDGGVALRVLHSTFEPRLGTRLRARLVLEPESLEEGLYEVNVGVFALVADERVPVVLPRALELRIVDTDAPDDDGADRLTGIRRSRGRRPWQLTWLE